ncbi:Hypothetical protein KVN_LOCUS238 [uncultured virus]|nr:Hypothetical protein KVN_LOCUS238 [uncultured virus]
MEYLCDSCNYSTDDKSNWNRHNLSKRHKNNKTCLTKNEPTFNHNSTDQNRPTNNNSKKDLKCEFCNKEFSYKSALKRHSDMRCMEKLNKNNQLFEKKLKDKEKEISNLKLESKDQEISFLKERLQDKEKILSDKEKEISELKYVLKTSGILKKSTFNSLTFIINNYDKAPNLLPLDNYQNIKSNKEDNEFVEILINCYENGNLATYLGNILIEAYKKEDSSKQSLWNTDSNRLTYLIKELMNNKSKWSIDKNGIKTSLNIINPLLTYLVPIIKQYINDLELQGPENARTVDQFLKKMENASHIKKEIDEKILTKDILKYISPYFYFDKKDELMIKE